MMFPYGNMPKDNIPAAQSPASIGALIRRTRKQLGVTQQDLALTAGTGVRFIIELEHGKETCEIGKVLEVLHTLGIRMTLTPPATLDEH